MNGTEIDEVTRANSSVDLYQEMGMLNNCFVVKISQSFNIKKLMNAESIHD